MAALENVGIAMANRLWAAREAMPALPPDGPCLVKAEPDEIVYDITFDLPDMGLVPGAVPPNNILPAILVHLHRLLMLPQIWTTRDHINIPHDLTGVYQSAI